MAFKKGRNKTGGRTKGTPNRTTENLRQLLKGFITEEAIKNDLAELTPAERLNFISKILPYVLPKMAEVEVTGTPINFIIPNTSDTDLISDEIK